VKKDIDEWRRALGVKTTKTISVAKRPVPDFQPELLLLLK
jgi:hypothetical protein